MSPPITKESDNGRLQESSRICIIGSPGSEPDRVCRCDAAPDQCRDDEVDGSQSRNAGILARKSGLGLGSRSGLVRGRRGRRSHRQRCVWLLWRAVLLWISIPTLQLRLFVQLFLFASLLRMHYVLRIPSSLL